MPEPVLLLPAVLLVYIAALARILLGSWFAPGAFFCLMWCGHMFLSFFVPEYEAEPKAVWWIVLTCFVFAASSLVGRAAVGRLQTQRDRAFNFFRPTLVICGGTVISAAYLVIQESGRSDPLNPALFLQLPLVFQFATPLLGGGMFASHALRYRALAFLPILPAALMAFVTTGRTSLMAPTILWVAGYLAFRASGRHGPPLKLRFKVVMAAVALLATFTIFGVLLNIHREEYVPDVGLRERLAIYQETTTWVRFEESWERFIRPYVFGNVYAFSVFFDRASESRAPLTRGTTIFAAPLDLVGYDINRYPFEYFEIERGVFSNVFTMFAPPIQDFGLGGSLIWWTAIAIVQGAAFERLRQGRVLPAVLVAWFYVDTALIGGYFFRYNSVIVSYGVVALYLLVSKRRVAEPEVEPVQSDRILVDA